MSAPWVLVGFTDAAFEQAGRLEVVMPVRLTPPVSGGGDGGASL